MKFCEDESETRCPSDATTDVIRLNLALNHDIEAVMLRGHEVNRLSQRPHLTHSEHGGGVDGVAAVGAEDGVTSTYEIGCINDG
jgi:hypothetical protein